jgi:hypothetical protein
MALHEKLKQIQVIDFLMDLLSFQERKNKLRMLRLLNKSKINNLYKIMYLNQWLDNFIQGLVK